MTLPTFVLTIYICNEAVRAFQFLTRLSRIPTLKNVNYSRQKEGHNQKLVSDKVGHLFHSIMICG